MDLVFLIDGSRSVRPHEFETMRTFMVDILRTLDVGLNATRVGVVQYSSQVMLGTPSPTVAMETSALIPSAGTHRVLPEQPRPPEQHGGGHPADHPAGPGHHDRLGHRLHHERGLHSPGGGQARGKPAPTSCLESCFASALTASLPQVPNVVVIVTDGRPQDRVAEVAAEARGRGLEIFAVGVARADMSSLRAMASPPLDDHIFLVESFDLIHQFGLQFQDKLCSKTGDAGVLR